MSAQESSSINEPFGSCVVSGDQIKVTPPHGALSSRSYLFDRARQTLTVSDKSFGIFGSKKNIEFSNISLRIAKGSTAAGYCIEATSRIPGKMLVVYQLTGYVDSADRLEQMKKTLTEGTGIKKWE